MRYIYHLFSVCFCHYSKYLSRLQPALPRNSRPQFRCQGHCLFSPRSLAAVPPCRPQPPADIATLPIIHCIVSSFIFLMGGRGEDFLLKASLAVFQYIVVSLLDNCVNEFKTNCQFQPRRTSPMCSFTRSQFRRMTSSTTASSGENTQYCSR